MREALSFASVYISVYSAVYFVNRHMQDGLERRSCGHRALSTKHSSKTEPVVCAVHSTGRKIHGYKIL